MNTNHIRPIALQNLSLIHIYVAGALKNPREWPLVHIQGILGLTGDKVLEITDAGAMQITVTTGQAVHQYTILASV